MTQTHDLPPIGIIGGSGLYAPGMLDEARSVTVETPWGAPSDRITLGRMAGRQMAFLPRHGRGHPLPPDAVPYQANIAALKMLGCRQVLAISAVGSLRPDFRPGDFVQVDQYIDRTTRRAPSFFGPGLVAHVSLADPTCPDLSAAATAAAQAAGATVHPAGTYLAMEGPQFSTRAESRMYRAWGADVIGMTGMPEARLAREAELCYASLAMVTDYDSWHEAEAAVDVTAILRVLTANATLAQATVAALPAQPATCGAGCGRALDHALMTAPSARDPKMVERLMPIAGRLLTQPPTE